MSFFTTTLTIQYKCVKIHLHRVYISSNYPLILHFIPVYNISIILLIIHQNPSSDFGPTWAEYMDTHMLGHIKLSSASMSYISMYTFADLFSHSYFPLLQFLYLNFTHVDSWTFSTSYWLQFYTSKTEIKLKQSQIYCCIFFFKSALAFSSLWRINTRQYIWAQETVTSLRQYQPVVRFLTT